MFNLNKTKLIIPVLLIVLIIGIQNKSRERIDKTDGPEFELYFTANPQYLKFMSAGFDGTIADYYWIKAVLYFGRMVTGDDLEMMSKLLKEDIKETEEYKQWRIEAEYRYRHLSDMLNIVIELDRYFLQPYLFGGLVLSLNAGQHEKSIEILQKGIKIFPGSWQFSYLLGYNYYFFLDDYEKASEYFRSAAANPDCPPGVKNAVTDITLDILKKSDKRIVAIDFIQIMIEQADSQAMKEKLEKLLEEIEKGKTI